ncbi:zinc ABC transporter substrate-binding protein [Providencia vermicola]|uniref:zinc ABC transporter substrate-binding protein n=1 Tax=Providencia vermicola TaxID=333965 RepID=UPI002201CBEC|nr:zinc ABC transporter substrate-binding protein [Providencia stuartii]
MTKNEIYVDMLFWILPYIRNIQSQDAKIKSEALSCYYESELIHNLPNKILINEFTSSDISFLNYQAKYYYENCTPKISILYSKNIEYIKMLFDLVPDELKEQLKWLGPKNNPIAN